MKKIRIIVSLFLSIFILGGCSSEIEKSEKMEKYTLYLSIKYDLNWFFDKYDLDLYLDDEKIDNIKYGDDYRKLIENVTEGNHTIRFQSVDNSSVYGKEDINISGNKTMTCTIKNSSSDVTIKDVNITDGIDSYYITVPNVIGLTYREAETKLEEVGLSSDHIEKTSYISKEDYVSSDWIVMLQSCEEGSKITVNDIITLSCAEDKKEDEKYQTTLDTTPEPEKQADVTYTIDNCPDLNNLLQKNDIEKSKEFCAQYDGKVIQFNGSILDMVDTGVKHTGNIYDILFSSNDYDSETVSGPIFKVKQFTAQGSHSSEYDIDGSEISFFDFSTKFRTGKNVVVTASIDKYDEDLDLIFIDVKEIRLR